MSAAESSSGLNEELRSDQRRRWLRGERVPVERYLVEHPDLSSDPRALVELAVWEFQLRRELGEVPDLTEYLERFPEQRETLKRLLETEPLSSPPAAGSGLDPTKSFVRPGLTCPFCSRALAQRPLDVQQPIRCEHCHKQVIVLDPTMTLAAEAVYSIGRFELRQRLGSGQFGDVWRGYDSDLRRDVAIKIPRRLPDDRNTRELFLREARAAARMRHPHIVPVYEVGNDENQVYIVSELVTGPTLRQSLEERRKTPAEAARLCQLLAEALEHAHQAGIVHRDLKPSNILLDERGEPHIADFGIAKVNLDEMTITPDGEVLGTPAYMSPEQARGDASLADARADIYSLGVVLYELLCGQRPFEGRGQALIQQILNNEPRRPSSRQRGVPPDLETICLKALAKEPAGRYATAGEMAADLGRFLKGKPIHARRRGLLSRAWRWSRRKNVAAALAVFLGGAMLIARPWTPEQNQTSLQIQTPSRDLTPDRNLIPARPATRRVFLETEPPGATVTLFPINAKTSEPEPHRGVECQALTPLELDLPPGDYFFVAVLDGHGFHEVNRHVPSEEEEIPWGYNHRQWRLAEDGTIHLPKIMIPPSFITDGMALVDGSNSFSMGRKDLKPYEPQVRKVPSFYMDPHEFTVGDCKAHLGRLPPKYRDNAIADDTPLADVDYDMAMHYAERAGKRLPTEAEFELAATARGTRRFPWGDTLPAESAEIRQDDPHAAAFDQSNTTPAVHGLASGLAEWTMTHAALAPTDELTSGKYVVRGGDSAVLRGDFRVTETGRDPRAKLIQYRSQRGPGLGFRCVRSVRPRLRPDDFGKALPVSVSAESR